MNVMIGLGYALGGALLGGTTPLIIASLTNWLDSPLVPAYYLMFSGLLGVTCVIWGTKVDSSESVSNPIITLSPNLASLEGRARIVTFRKH